MRQKTNKHEDHRRILTEFISDIPIYCCKVIEVKEDCVLGNHYHNKKDDYFYLLKGKGTWQIGGMVGTFKEGDKLFAEKGHVHVITLEKGSILIEASTTPYEKEDEIKA